MPGAGRTRERPCEDGHTVGKASASTAPLATTPPKVHISSLVRTGSAVDAPVVEAYCRPVARVSCRSVNSQFALRRSRSVSIIQRFLPKEEPKRGCRRKGPVGFTWHASELL